MKTSNFRQARALPGRISIARFIPRWAPAGYRCYRDLAPPREIIHLTDQAKYRRIYQDTVLARLDPAKVAAELHQIAGDAEPVLLCWEDLGKHGEFCHRTMVAEWLRDTLGLRVAEMR